MKKWPLFLLGSAAIVVIGCGGVGSGKHTTSTTTTTGNGDSIATVNLAGPGGVVPPPFVNIDYVTGQGRAQGDIVANIGPTNLIDANGNIATIPLPQYLNLLLNGYTQQIESLDITTNRNANSNFYTIFELIIPQIQILDDQNNVSQTITGPNGSYFVDHQFAAKIPAFPGRQTALNVYLDDAIIAVDPNTGNYTFNVNQFLNSNTTAGDPSVIGWLSDYVQFDISHMAAANRPLLADGVTPASWVFFSGEDQRYGASPPISGSSTQGFTVYTPVGTLTGTIQGPNQIANYGSYTLRVPDPRDLSNKAKITALQGIYRPVAQVMNNLGTFEVITFPHAGDDQSQDMIMMVRDANGNITNMYFGIVNLGSTVLGGGAGDIPADSFAVYPIANLATGDISGQITGTVSAFSDSSGATTTVPQNARAGRYSMSGTLPAGFRTSGRFIVFRA